MRFLLPTALLAGLLALAPAAQARRDVTLTINVTFSVGGAITVTLPDGTPVGSTSGPPTVIPAGYYTIVLYGPGGCISLPLFQLNGPGEAINDDMYGGEVDTHTYNAYLLPNSTYTWRSDANQTLAHTFVTSGAVVGTAPTGSGGTTTTKGSGSPGDVVGSAILPFRGNLAGMVSPSGALSFSFKGKSVTTLKAGKYTITVTDKSTTSGFLVQKLRHAAVNVTGKAFVGTRSASISLTAGKWVVAPSAGKTAYSLVVS